MDENVTLMTNFSTFDNESYSPIVTPRGFPPTLIAFITLQQIVFVFACIGNGIIIILFKWYIKPITNTSKFIISLAVADFATGLSSGSQIFYFFYRDLSMNMYTCFIRYLVVMVMTLVSQLSVAFTTLDRYIAICHYQKYGQIMTNTTANVMIAFSWIYAFCLGFLPLVGVHKWEPGMRCSYGYLFPEWFYLTAATTVYSFMFFSFAVYGLILHKAWEYYQQTLKRMEASTNQDRKEKVEKNIRSAKVMGIVTMAFILCWAPYTVYQVRYGMGNKKDLTNFDLSSWLVFWGILNSIMNPFIYAWQRRDFREALFRLLSCRAKTDHGESSKYADPSSKSTHLSTTMTNAPTK